MVNHRYGNRKTVTDGRKKHLTEKEGRKKAPTEKEGRKKQLIMTVVEGRKKGSGLSVTLVEQACEPQSTKQTNEDIEQLTMKTLVTCTMHVRSYIMFMTSIIMTAPRHPRIIVLRTSLWGVGSSLVYSVGIQLNYPHNRGIFSASG